MPPAVWDARTRRADRTENSEETQTDETPQGRRRELDALRGLAALAVLGYHTLATNSKTLNSGVNLGPVANPWAHLLVYSPLHVAWLGAEAVWLFFLLSGFVLTRSAMSSSFSWSAYYPSRLVRLYLPVLLAVVVAWGVYLIPHHVTPATQGLPTSYPLEDMLHDVFLLGGGTSTEIGTLWSLQWEVLFSLLLPVYLVLARRHAVVSGLLALGILTLGWRYGDVTATYMPIFFVGSLLAVFWDRLSARLTFLERRGVVANLAGLALLVTATCAITSYFLVGRSIHVSGWSSRVLTLPIVLAGAAMLVVLVQTWRPLRSLLRTRALTFVGTISFSLYLTHRPIVLLCIFLLQPGHRAAVAGVVLSLVVAVAFYYVAERPAHRLSRRMKESVTPGREAVALALGDRDGTPTPVVSTQAG